MNRPTRSAFAAATAVALSAAMIASGFAATQAAWEPKEPIDFVIMPGKGSGADKMARVMQTIVEKHNLSSKPLIPIDNPGGSGADALVHLKHKTGDDHTIMVTLDSFYTTPVRQPGPDFDATTFTPIDRMAEDTFLLWTHAEPDVNTVDEFVDAAMAAGNDWIMVGTGEGQEDELFTTFLNTAYGLDMKYVPFRGGGRVAKELTGKNANSTVNNPSEQVAFYEEGKSRPLAEFTPERLELFSDAAMFVDSGLAGSLACREIRDEKKREECVERVRSALWFIRAVKAAEAQGAKLQEYFWDHVSKIRLDDLPQDPLGDIFWRPERIHR